MKKRVRATSTPGARSRLKKTPKKAAPEHQMGGSLPASFLATAAHDLRNPLSAVFGYAEALLMEPKGNSLTVRQRDLLTRIRGASLRGLELAKNLQAFATAGARHVKTARKHRADHYTSEHHAYRCPVLPAIQGAVEAVWFPPERNLTLKQNLQITPATTIALAPHELERVIANLLSNAVKFSPDGSTITIATSVDELRSVVTLHVHNSGTFISAQDRARIFDAFEQAPVNHVKATAHRAQSRAKRAMKHVLAPYGTGLGLWIVSQLVRQAGGTVTVNSDKHRGTEFVVTLPKMRQ